MQTTIPIIYSCVLYLSYFALRVSFRLLFCFASLSPRSIFRSLSSDLELDAFPPGGIRTRQDQPSTIFEYESTCNLKVHHVIYQSRHFASLELRSSEIFSVLSASYVQSLAYAPYRTDAKGQETRDPRWTLLTRETA